MLSLTLQGYQGCGSISRRPSVEGITRGFFCCPDTTCYEMKTAESMTLVLMEQVTAAQL